MGPVFQFSDFPLGVGECLHVYNELSPGWDASWAVGCLPALDTDSNEVCWREGGRHSRGWHLHGFVLEDSIALMAFFKPELTENPKCL